MTRHSFPERDTGFLSAQITKIKKDRALPEYMQFNIYIADNGRGMFADIRATDGTELPSYRERLTPSQWKKASVYLTRQLVPFAGYTYQVKPGVTVGVYKIR